MEKLKYLAIFSMATMISSCSFEDHGCVYQGNLIAYVKDKDLRQQDKGSLVYYTLADVEEQTFWGSVDYFKTDTLRSYIYKGSYDLLYFEKGINKANVEDKSHEEVSLSAPTYSKNGLTFTPEQTFITSGFEESVLIKHDEDTYCPIDVKPLVLEFDFHINVISPEQKIESMKGVLSGVSIGKKVFTRVASKEYASMEFELSRKDEKSYREYIKTLYSLGVNHGVSNILYLYATLSDNSQRVAEVDLSELLRNFDEGKITINLDIDLSREISFPIITITDWEISNYEPITLTPIQ